LTRQKTTQQNNHQLKFIANPAGSIIADIGDTLPGNALWLPCHRQAVVEAIAAGGFDALLPARAADNLPEMVEKQLRRECLALIALAKKSGVLIAGYEKVRGEIASGHISLLIQANDSRGRQLFLPNNSKPPVLLFSSDELSAVIGRQHVVYIALKSGKLTDTLRVATGRLTEYNTNNQL